MIGTSRLPRRPVAALAFAAAFVCLHAVGVAAFPAQATLLSYTFMTLAPLMAGAACLRWALTRTAGPRLCGTFVALGLLIWSAGVVLDGWQELVVRSTQATALPDVLYFLYGAPMLIAISASSAEMRARDVLSLQGVQSLVIAYFAATVLFAAAPFTGETAAPLSGDRLSQAFLIENVILAGAATLRLFACANAAEREFYRTLAGFFWLYLAVSTSYNFYVVDAITAPASIYDALMDVPFLMLALSFIRAPGRGRGADAPARPTLSLIVASTTPLSLTFATLALGTLVMERHPAVGAAGVALGLGCYGLQSTLLQTRRLRFQQSLTESLRRLERLSLTDALTRVANRRCFDQTLDREWRRASRSGQPLSLLMIDLDFFKNLNDRYGHVYGDECLISIAKALREMLPRDGDMLARYGGEEFAAILPGTDRAGAQTVADKMRDAVRRLAIQNETVLGDIATISIGISTCDPILGASSVDLLKGSDNALYRAKQDGRDRVEFSSAL